LKKYGYEIANDAGVKLLVFKVFVTGSHHRKTYKMNVGISNV